LTTAYINRIGAAVPPHDIHQAFLQFAEWVLREDSRRVFLFRRMAERAEIDHRYSCLADPEGFYLGGGAFPDTSARMRAFEAHAPELAAAAVDQLDLGHDRDRITHLLITSCTGFSAPGLDLDLVERCGLRSSVERTIIGFMGCYAAIPALKLARHIIRSAPTARVLVLNLELCTLHLRETTDLDKILCFLLFADGCSAALVTSDPHGIALDSFQALLVPGTRGQITWNIRNFGFDMVLSGLVPATIERALRDHATEILGAPVTDIDLWAVHPGGRSVLDAVQRAFSLAPAALSASRDILRRYGNMSSATVMFVLDKLLRSDSRGSAGCAMSFGPGLVAETMLFHAVGGFAKADGDRAAAPGLA
jgi:alpha-pyrone synthase